jgi:hypothetical protein
MLGRSGVARVLRVREVRDGGRRFTADWWEVGTVEDLAALGWQLTKRLELATSIGNILEAIHGAGAALGALRPDDVLFDDDLEPVLGPLTLPGSADARDAVYTAPEARGGGVPDARSDVFAFGQLLHFVLGGCDPEPSPDLVPLLAALTALPAGLTRILRKATCVDAAMRYPSIAAMLADLERYGSVEEVGMAHAHAAEPNKTGLSLRTGARPVEPAAAPSPPSRLKPNAAPRSGPGARPKIAKPSFGERYRRFRGSRLFKPLAAGAAAAVGIFLIGGAASIAGVGRQIEDARLEAASNAERAVLVTSMHQGGRRDFAALSLAGSDLRKADLSHADLEGADLSSADLGDANLAYANLTGAKLQGARLHGADLTGATLDDSAAGTECSAQTLAPDGWVCKSGRLAMTGASHAQATNEPR